MLGSAPKTEDFNPKMGRWASKNGVGGGGQKVGGWGSELGGFYPKMLRIVKMRDSDLKMGTEG